MSRRMITTVLMAVGAIACGAFAAFLGYQYIQATLARERQRLEARYDPIEVVVAQQSLERGDILDSGRVAVREVPRAFVHDSALRPGEWQSASGRSMTVAVGQGETILQTHIARSRGQLEVPSGRRALTIPVNRESAIGGLLQPDDRVDLLMTMPGPDNGSSVTFPLLEGVRVAAADGRFDARRVGGTADDRRPPETITITVTPQDASRITHARKIGDLTVSLRRDSDDGVGHVGVVNKQALLDEYFDSTEEDDPEVKKKQVEIIVGRGG